MMAIGHLKGLKPDAGYGWIEPDDGGPQDYFFHRSALDLTAGQRFEDLREGDKVEFVEVDNSPKGPRAASVRPI